ncbi:helix-turn-helix domain-containing protein [Muricoccus vinaceus]|uniref:Helix-turn-helix domain-containing protein n=1 Tax=Muricoccus vinaceus TaxID=424704 RepID=A0ABV6J0U8_9PROT
MENINTGQLRAARALLRWTAEDLAKRAGVSVVTIRRAEPADGMLTMMPANAAAIRRALEEAGVEFIPENGGGAGVRMRKGLHAAEPRSKPDGD